MKFLFYLTHPSKFHQFRYTINKLKSESHEVDIIINNKDVIKNLVDEEGWEYKDLFPKGRKIKWLPYKMWLVFGLLWTLYRLLKYCKGKNYNLFVHGELPLISKITGTPSIFFTDDPYAIAPHAGLIFHNCNYVVTPEVCDMSIFNEKRITYKGYKALAHLHPKVFRPDEGKIHTSLKPGNFFLIRLCEFTSAHDVSTKKVKGGIDNIMLRKIVDKLKDKGPIVISAERSIPKDFRKYQIVEIKKDISHYIYYSKLFVGDSLTMCTESAVLGTPTIDCDDWWPKYDQMLELQDIYGLVYGINTDNYSGMIATIDLILKNLDKNPNEYSERKEKMLKKMINVPKFTHWLISNYPASINTLKNNPDYQYNFN